MGDASDRVLEWELGLPAAGELTPLSHSLISPELAAAFHISPEDLFLTPLDVHLASESTIARLLGRHSPSSSSSSEDEEAEPGDASGAAPRGGRKKQRLVWTPELHHRFVEVVAHLGDKGAVPKAIVQLMNVDGLTRENVASHLQKYRLYLKRTRPGAAGSEEDAACLQLQPPHPAMQYSASPGARLTGLSSSAYSAASPFAFAPPPSGHQNASACGAYDFPWPHAPLMDRRSA